MKLPIWLWEQKTLRSIIFFGVFAFQYLVMETIALVDSLTQLLHPELKPGAR
jgi:hypothetical protein